VCLDKEAAAARLKRLDPEAVEQQRAQQKKWRAANKDAVRIRNKRNGHGIKVEVINRYGGACVCCGEDGIPFLGMDHINGDGARHRRAHFKNERHGAGSPFYYWIKKNNFPDFLQVLCHNCNLAKGTGKVCPHKMKIPNPSQLTLFDLEVS
jgi:hypothetical protein